MELMFLICAVAGGTLLAVQLLLMFIGGDGGAEADLSADVGDVADLPEDVGEYHVDAGEGPGGDASAAAFKFLSMKTIVAFFTFFGLGGLLGLEYELGGPTTMGVAIVAGLVAFYLVGWVWMLVYRLQSRGNLDVRNALGLMGHVYLRVPPRGEGLGKVILQLQGRTVELNASTSADEEIPTGERVRVVGIAASDIVRVLPVADAKEASHAG